MANGNGNGTKKKNGNGKKKIQPVKPPAVRRAGNGNGKKKIQPVKPPKARRGGKVKETIKTIIAPETQIAKKMKDKSWRKKVKEGFLKGITFGLYKP